MTAKITASPSSEADHQKNLMEWSKIVRAKYPELALLHAIPNGGSRNKIEARHMKEQGVKSGVPDLFLPISRRGYHGAYIEMKRPKPKGHVSPEQKWWGEKLTAQGYLWCVCYGWEQARELLEWYLGGDGENGKVETVSVLRE